MDLIRIQKGIMPIAGTIDKYYKASSKEMMSISQGKLYKLVLRCTLSHLSSKWTERLVDSAIFGITNALREMKEAGLTLAGKIRYSLPGE